MKLVAYILLVLGFAVSSVAHDGSRPLANCSNDIYDVSLTAVDGSLALIKIYENGEKVSSGLTQYQKSYYEDNAHLIQIKAITKAHGVTPMFAGAFYNCGTWCGGNNSAGISYYDLQQDIMVDLPELNCTGVN